MMGGLRLISPTSILPASRVGRVLFCFFLVAGTILRFTNLDAQSFWLDEVYSAGIVEAPIAKILSSIPPDKPPLEYYAQALFSRLSDNKELVHRLPAAIAGSLFLFVLYLLAVEIFSRRVAVIALGLAAFNTFLIAYSQEARPYSLSLMFITLNMLCFVRWLRSSTPWSPRAFAALTITSIASAYTLYAGLVITAAELLVLIILSIPAVSRRDGSDTGSIGWSCIAAFGASSLLLLASLLPLYSRTSIYPPKDFIWYFEKFTPGQFTKIYSLALVGGIPVAPIFGAIAGVAATAAGIVAALNPRRLRVALLPIMILVTVALFPFFYYVINRTLFPRYMIFVMPSLIVMMASGINLAFSRFSHTRAGANALLCAGGLLYIPMSTWFFFFPTNTKVDWRGAAQFIAGRATPDAIVSATDAMETVPLHYYIQRFGRRDLMVVARDGSDINAIEHATWVLSTDQAKESHKNTYSHVRIQFVRQTPPTRDYRAYLPRAGAEQKLIVGAMPDDLLGAGWSFLEYWEKERPMRWAMASHSTVFLPIATGGAGTISISCMPYSFKSGPHQTVGLTINGVDLETRELEGSDFRDVAWQVPDGVAKAGYNRVVFHFSRLRGRADFVPSFGDTRPVAAVIDWIKWQPGETAAP